jgi:hypothetical protein
VRGSKRLSYKDRTIIFKIGEFNFKKTAYSGQVEDKDIQVKTFFGKSYNGDIKKNLIMHEYPGE